MSTGEPVAEPESSSSLSSSAEQVDELRAALTAKVAALLAVDDQDARDIVEAFDTHIARPLEKKFAELQPHDLTTLWERLTGQKDVPPRLAATARLLSVLVSARAHDEAERLKRDAVRSFAAEDGTLDLGKLIDPPPRPRRRGDRALSSAEGQGELPSS